MKKQLFSVMLCLGALGGLSTFPMPLQAAVSQSQTIKVKGQIVDDQGNTLDDNGGNYYKPGDELVLDAGATVRGRDRSLGRLWGLRARSIPM